ncbi:hypothetical protein BN126_3467 [Cronobacter sakazakii 680]|nr:hypothetical protein BN126_3467 [Cronobacter sakazakii 680]
MKKKRLKPLEIGARLPLSNFIGLLFSINRNMRNTENIRLIEI